MFLDFSGSRAVVTGGANGIGRAAAAELVKSGAAVTIFDLGREKPEEVAATFGARGVAVDVTDPASIEAAFAEVGICDVVIANAGVVAPSSVLETRAADWERTLAVNLTGVFNTVQAAARRMQGRGHGAIVLTASTNSYDGEEGLVAYNTSKAGLLGLVHTAANELGPFGIRVNAVCPGMIRTRMSEPLFRNEAFIKEYFRNVPLGRGGLPEEVAQAILFLASACASYITGATLVIDGGQMAAKFGPWRDESAAFEAGQWRLRSPLPGGSP